jgi:membrane-bound metal-dependent hydrolase YbcI (DUF457 family)
MPSPVGHVLAAVTVGWLAAPVPRDERALRRSALIFAAVGVAPDLDLFVGRHSAETHSIGAAVIVASLAAWRMWPVAADRWRIWLAVFLAWICHPILDALALDTSPPLGVMLLWPASREHMQSGLEVFVAISRRYWLPEFVLHNLRAVIREVLLLVPPLAFVWWWRRAVSARG